MLSWSASTLMVAYRTRLTRLLARKRLEEVNNSGVHHLLAESFALLYPYEDQISTEDGLQKFKVENFSHSLCWIGLLEPVSCFILR
jgi:hypothetical protein